MIGRLRGQVAAISDGELLLDVNGVGYELSCSALALRALPGEGEVVTLWVETLVREDAIQLCGFVSEVERAWFRLLTSVQGVGTKAALAILSVVTGGELVAAVTRQDHVPLVRASGVGPKLATRVVHELKGKALPGSLNIGAAVVSLRAVAEEGVWADALSALMNLGYSRHQAGQALAVVQKLEETPGALDQIIPRALRELKLA